MTITEKRELNPVTTEKPAPPVAAKPKAIQRIVGDDGICVLTFDRPDSSANVFDRATMNELNEHLDFITGNNALKGVILTSAKQSIFIAGADLHALFAGAHSPDMAELIELGQAVFNRLDALDIPTVAAIHGACVGGGYELCLTCDYRLASPERVTKIGLPETQLGILPAWGGSTRLPRLIGLPKALDVILAGKTLAAKPALKAGLVDELAPREYLVEVARRKILSEGRKLLRRPRSLKIAALNSSLVARFIHRKLQADLLKKTRGHYPAVLKALDVVTRGVTRPVGESLELEMTAVLELAQTEACHNLIRIFFMQERAKKSKSAGAPELKPVRRLAVVGAGVMGAGIAQWASARDCPVILRDINAEQVAKGVAGIARLYEEGVKRHTFTKVEARAGLDRVSPAASDVPLRHVDLVIEAAVEKMNLKKDLFRKLDERAGPETILATNTSALSVSEIAESTAHPERVVGIHFFNPVHRMQLVEVIVGTRTSGEVLRRAVKFVQQLGKLPVVVKDSPGFLVNRILMPYLIEAGHLFETGARVEDIDEAMLDFGMPMGPLRLIDEVGVDVSNHVAATLAAKFSARLTIPAVLGKMLEAGWLGRKSGRGFYLHEKKGKEPDVNPHLDKFHVGATSAAFNREELRTRMALLMVNEAARCIEEDIVMEPADADFGMIMGTGFAPFLGGPLRFADFVGLPEIVEEMKRLAAREPRFAPCALLQEMATSGRKFYPQKGNKS